MKTKSGSLTTCFISHNTSGLVFGLRKVARLIPTEIQAFRRIFDAFLTQLPRQFIINFLFAERTGQDAVSCNDRPRAPHKPHSFGGKTRREH